MTVTIDHTQHAPCPKGWSRAILHYEDVAIINWVSPASIAFAERVVCGAQALSRMKPSERARLESARTLLLGLQDD